MKNEIDKKLDAILQQNYANRRQEIAGMSRRIAKELELKNQRVVAVYDGVIEQGQILDVVHKLFRGKSLRVLNFLSGKMSTIIDTLKNASTDYEPSWRNQVIVLPAFKNSSHEEIVSVLNTINGYVDVCVKESQRLVIFLDDALYNEAAEFSPLIDKSAEVFFPKAADKIEKAQTTQLTTYL